MATRRKPSRQRRTQRPRTSGAEVAQLLPSPFALGSGVGGLVVVLMFSILPWYLSVALAVVLLVVAHDGVQWYRARQQQVLRVQAQTQTDVDRIWRMTGTEFEHWTAGILRGWCGWRDVTVRGGSGDRGVDIIGRNARGERCVIQCKRQDAPVEIKVVQAIYGNINHEIDHQKASRAYLVTTNDITPGTRAWIGDKPIEIWNGRYLKQLITTQRASQEDAAGAAGWRAAAWLPRIWKPLLGGLATWCLLLLVLTSSWSTWATRNAAGRSASLPILQLAPTPAVMATPPDRTSPTMAGGVPLATTVAIARDPGVNAPAILQLRAGDQVRPLGRTADGAWLLVRSAFGIEGWLPTASLSYSATLRDQLPLR